MLSDPPVMCGWAVRWGKPLVGVWGRAGGGVGRAGARGTGVRKNAPRNAELCFDALHHPPLGRSGNESDKEVEVDS
ncbi:hypothetical protein GCM10009550_72440 [Actinocorallia libanotica]|uniref:Uncharacterized protein n=1 Tax=Actinocorallia libanotica TaxID=46162 RepID=A0ABP4CGG3_9ACTN